MTELRNLLSDLAEQAKTYDVVERAYQRSRRRRWLIPVVTCTGVLLTAAGTVAAVQGYGGATTPGAAAVPPVPANQQSAPPFPTACTGQVLAMPSGFPPKAIVSGGDPTGRYIIGRGYPSIVDDDAPSYASLLWDDGVPIELNVPGAETVPEDVNSAGEVIITSWGGTTAGYHYRDGVLTKLAGSGVIVRAISESGVIVGSVTMPSDDPFAMPPQRPAVWRTATAQPELLGPADLFGTAIGIDDEGTIVVFVQLHREPGSVVRFAADGAMTTIEPPGGDGPAVHQIRSYANGWIVTLDQSSIFKSYLWHLDGGQAQALPDFGDALNGHGWVALSLDSLPVIGQPFTPEGTAFLRAPDGTEVNLPPVAGPYEGYAIMPAYVSDDGRTVAGQLNDPTYESLDADTVGVVWHCG